MMMIDAETMLEVQTVTTGIAAAEGRPAAVQTVATGIAGPSTSHRPTASATTDPRLTTTLCTWPDVQTAWHLRSEQQFEIYETATSVPCG